MKKILVFIIYLLAVLSSAAAQDTIPLKTNINKANVFFPRSLPSVNNGYLLYIVDGKLIDDTLTDWLTISNININTIYSLKVLKVIAPDPYHGAQGVIIINTKMFAATQYEKKFSSFSKKYKNYLANHHNDDKYCFYVLDGTPIEGKSDERIRKLNEIPVEKIKAVNIMANPYINGNINNKEIVVIATIK